MEWIVKPSEKLLRKREQQREHSQKARDFAKHFKRTEWMRKLSIPDNYTEQELEEQESNYWKKLALLDNIIEWDFVGKKSHKFLCKMIKVQP